MTSNHVIPKTTDHPKATVTLFWALFFWIAVTAGIMWICGIWRLTDTLVGFFTGMIFDQRLLYDEEADTSKKIGGGWTWITAMCLALWFQGHCPLWISIIMAIIWIVFVSFKWLAEKWLDSQDTSTYEDKKS